MNQHFPPQTFQKRKKEKKGKKEALPHNMSRYDHKLPFSYVDCWLIPYISGETGLQVRNFKNPFVIFFCILLKVNDALCDRRMMKSQKSAGAMTAALYGGGSFQLSLVCKIRRTSTAESVNSVSS